MVWLAMSLIQRDHATEPSRRLGQETGRCVDLPRILHRLAGDPRRIMCLQNLAGRVPR